MGVHYQERDDGSFTVTYDSPEEDPNYQAEGQCIELEAGQKVIARLERCSPEQFDAEAPAIIEKLHLMARVKLKPGTRYDIRGKIPTDFGRGRGLAWYTSHALQQLPVTGPIAYPGKMNPLGGYMMLGTFKVPGG